MDPAPPHITARLHARSAPNGNFLPAGCRESQKSLNAKNRICGVAKRYSQVFPQSSPRDAIYVGTLDSCARCNSDRRGRCGRNGAVYAVPRWTYFSHQVVKTPLQASRLFWPVHVMPMWLYSTNWASMYLMAKM